MKTIAFILLSFSILTCFSQENSTQKPIEIKLKDNKRASENVKINNDQQVERKSRQAKIDRDHSTIRLERHQRPHFDRNKEHNKREHRRESNREHQMNHEHHLDNRRDRLDRERK